MEEIMEDVMEETTKHSKASANTGPILQAIGVTRTFGSGEAAVKALAGVDLSIPPARLIALRGRSGSGKTTLLNLLGALDTPTDGSIYFEGKEISQMAEKKRNELRKRSMGLIFQSFALLPFMSAYENVEFGLRIAEVSSRHYKSFAEEALEFVGLLKRMQHRPHEMSGGEQQRVAIARAIAHRPTLLLADEPTANLDSKMGLQVMKVFKDLVQKEHMTIVITTHDPAIMEIVDHVYALEDGQIVDEG
jgi:putative ABC transport system ATP-binding protein